MLKFFRFFRWLFHIHAIELADPDSGAVGILVVSEANIFNETDDIQLFTSIPSRREWRMRPGDTFQMDWDFRITWNKDGSIRFHNPLEKNPIDLHPGQRFESKHRLKSKWFKDSRDYDISMLEDKGDEDAESIDTAF